MRFWIYKAEACHYLSLCAFIFNIPLSLVSYILPAMVKMLLLLIGLTIHKLRPKSRYRSKKERGKKSEGRAGWTDGLIWVAPGPVFNFRWETICLKAHRHGGRGIVSKHIHTRRKREVVDIEGKKTHKEESAAVLSLLLCPSCTHVFLSALSLSLHLPAAIPCCLNSVLLPSQCVWSASLLQLLETGKVWADKHDYTDTK